MDPFLRCCEEGNFEKAKKMLQTDPKNRSRLLRLTNPYGWNCLHFAAYHGSVEFVRYLLTLPELEINAKDRRGITAFHRALQRQRSTNMITDADGQQIVLYEPTPTIEILTMLFEVNNRFINCCDTYNVSPLRTALAYHHLDVVKLLIDFGSAVNHKNNQGSSELHIVAAVRRLDCVRYLLFEMDCDPSIPDGNGWLACCKFVKSILLNRPPTKEEIDFSVEFMFLSYDEPAETVQAFFLLLDCFINTENDGHVVFTEIVRKLLLPKHPKKNLIDRILRAKLPSDFCLITLILFVTIKKNIDKCKMRSTVTALYLQHLEDLKSNFLLELFTLYSVDESLFHDYLAEAVKYQWKFNELRPMTKFCSILTKETSTQSVFTFMKSLLLHDFSFVNSLEPSLSMLPLHLSNHLLNVFAPLSNFVIAPIEILKTYGSQKCYLPIALSELDNSIRYKKRVELKRCHRGVFPLQNLARMSIRKHFFQNYTHYEALSLLYSLNLPREVKQFLCYNYLNLKF